MDVPGIEYGTFCQPSMCLATKEPAAQTENLPARSAIHTKLSYTHAHGALRMPNAEVKLGVVARFALTPPVVCGIACLRLFLRDVTDDVAVPAFL